jgi:LysM domain
MHPRPILFPDIILQMKIRPVVISSALLSIFVIFGVSLPVLAAPSQQQFATSTPLPDGRILYKVQPGDTCSRIFLLNGISLEQLMQNNSNINPACSNLIPGSLLVIGLNGPAVASGTPGASSTPIPDTITPTLQAGTTKICVLLFNDLNGDALHEINEPVIEGGAISVTEVNGKYSKTLDTAVNPDPTAYQGTCFVDVPEGTYNIGAAIPDNYNPTMSLTYALDLKAGDSAYVDFGAQARDSTSSQSGNTDGGGGGPSPILGFLGGFLLLGGLGLGWFALRLREPQSKLKRSGLLKK